MEFEERERQYRQKKYYWGKEPSSLAQLTESYLPPSGSNPQLVDLGAGEGRDAVFFAELGFDVLAIDISPAGLKKATRLAAERELEIATLRADINNIQLRREPVVIFSSGALQFIRPDVRNRQFSRFKATTRSGGLHAMFAFVDHPDIPQAPDTTDDQIPFGRTELQSYYDDWETVYSEEVRFWDDSGGDVHEHAARIHLAGKPDNK